MLDRHADVVNGEVRENLGGWLQRRLKHGVEARGLAADEELSKIEIPIHALCKQWTQQRAAQLSIRNRRLPNPLFLRTTYLALDAPARLKWELDAVLTLQTELDSITQYFQHVQKAISEDRGNPKVPRFFKSLCRTHKETISRVEELYSSLNVMDKFPEVRGLPLDFVWTLLMARDLKINIRK